MTSVVIEFFHVDPTAEAGEYMSSEEPGKYFSLADPESSLAILQNPSDVVINKPSIRVVFSYPFDREYIFELYATNGEFFTRADLAIAITYQYQKMYNEEEKTTTISPEHIPGMLNRVITNGTYGIWGHDLSDLDLYEVRYNPETDLYTLGIDS